MAERSIDKIPWSRLNVPNQLSGMEGILSQLIEWNGDWDTLIEAYISQPLSLPLTGLFRDRDPRVAIDLLRGFFHNPINGPVNALVVRYGLADNPSGPVSKGIAIARGRYRPRFFVTHERYWSEWWRTTDKLPSGEHLWEVIQSDWPRPVTDLRSSQEFLDRGRRRILAGSYDSKLTSTLVENRPGWAFQVEL